MAQLTDFLPLSHPEAGVTHMRVCTHTYRRSVHVRGTSACVNMHTILVNVHVHAQVETHPKMAVVAGDRECVVKSERKLERHNRMSEAERETEAVKMLMRSSTESSRCIPFTAKGMFCYLNVFWFFSSGRNIGENNKVPGGKDIFSRLSAQDASQPCFPAVHLASLTQKIDFYFN